MAKSTCIRCGHIGFELIEHEPTDAGFKVNFIQCSACGGVVGVRDYYDNNTLLIEQNKALKTMMGHLGILDQPDLLHLLQ